MLEIRSQKIEGDEMIKTYKDLEIYKKSYDFALEIHKITKTYNEEEKYDLVSQMRRCSKSVPTNIAEGYGRQSKEEFKRFLRISLGSSNEMEVHLSFSKDLGYISEEKYIKLSQENDEIGKMLSSTLRKWK